jgi:hypothetical protein
MTIRSRLRRGRKNDKALRDIKHSPEALALLKKQAQAIARRANGTLKRKQSYPDYGSAVHTQGKEPTATVFTRSNHAKLSNAKHHTLIKVIK